MNGDYQYYVAFPLFLLTLGIGLYNFPSMDKGGKIICFLLFTEILNESIALYTATKFHTNIPEYNIYSLVELSITCWYFNNIIDTFKRKNIGFYIGVVGVGLGILDLIFLEHINVMNSYFLFLEGFLIIGMCLFAFFRLLLKHDELRLFKYTHFWFICIFLFFWCITYLSWGLYDIIGKNFSQYIPIISFCIWMVNIITYGGIGLIFFFYPKMQNSDDK